MVIDLLGTGVEISVEMGEAGNFLTFSEENMTFTLKNDLIVVDAENIGSWPIKISLTTEYIGITSV